MNIHISAPIQIPANTPITTDTLILLAQRQGVLISTEKR